MLTRVLIAFFVLFLCSGPALAIPGPITIDSRIKTYIYSPTEVFPVTVHYGYSMHIDLRTNESVRDIILGDNSDWSISVKGNRIFIRANEVGAHTNMTVMTNKDVYEFDLFSRGADDGIDLEMAYVVRFFYPPSDEEMSQTLNEGFALSNEKEIKSVGDLLSSDVNYAFKISGDQAATPIVVFTDGRLTYFKFTNNNKTIPLIYEVSGGQEKLLDVLEYNGYIIVNSTTAKFALKYDKKKATVEKE